MFRRLQEEAPEMGLEGHTQMPAGLLSRPCRKRRPSAREDGGAFGGRRKAVRDRLALQGGTGDPCTPSLSTSTRLVTLPCSYL